MLVLVGSSLRLKVLSIVMTLIGAGWVLLLLFRVVTIGSGVLPYGLRMGLAGGIGFMVMIWGVTSFQKADAMPRNEDAREAPRVLGHHR
jgi:hypothetical protein